MGEPVELKVAAGLVFRDGRLLITRRPAGGHLAGLWEFPGGKLEPGESWEEGLKRELREELDVEVEVGRLVSEVHHAYPEKRVHLRFFACRLRSGEPRPIGCAGLEWVRPAELGRFEFPEADRQLLGELPSVPEFLPESL